MSYYGRTYPTRTQRAFTARTSGAWKNDPITETQVSKILRELNRREIDPAMRDELLTAVNNRVTRDGQPATKGSASKLIDWLVAKPFVSGRGYYDGLTGTEKAAGNGTVQIEGIYRFTDGSVYRVVESKRNPGRFVAKMVTGHGWEYAKGMIFKLTAQMLMTPEQIAEFGISSGVCAQCSRKLDDPVSKRIGLGTKCGPAILGKDVYNAARKNAKLDPQVAEQLAAIEAGKTGLPARDLDFDVAEWDRMKQEAAQREAEQERAAEQAKWEWKQSVERF